MAGFQAQSVTVYARFCKDLLGARRSQGITWIQSTAQKWQDGLVSSGRATSSLRPGAL